MKSRYLFRKGNIHGLNVVLIVSMLFLYSPVFSLDRHSETTIPGMVKDTNGSLVVLWTSADREVALKMIYMYTFNAKKFEWWSKITIIVWGPSARLLADDTELQAKFKELMENGIVVKACKGCSDQYPGVSEKLSSLGIEVLYVGKEFTEYLKSDAHVLTL